MAPDLPLSLADVEAAAVRLKGIARPTPVLHDDEIDERVGARVLIKAESLQHGGAFKLRGAHNAIAALDDQTRALGVFAFSSGNHAQGVARAARHFDVSAVILMPEDAPPNKLEATRALGAEVITYDRYTVDRSELGARLASERGMTMVPPFDDVHVAAGQGTVALEFLAEVGSLDAFIAPIGGGGLLSGCATVIKADNQAARIFGAEPAGRPAARAALEAGEPMKVEVRPTIADGQQTEWIGEIPLRVFQAHLETVIGVTDEEIVGAMRLLADRCHIMAEPSGATALAALLYHGLRFAEADVVGLVVSGGNITSSRFAELTG